MSIEAMTQALEALNHKKWFLIGSGKPNDPKVEAAITALRTAIEATEKQEPVAWGLMDEMITIEKMLRQAAEYADTHTKDMEPNDDEWSALRDKRFAELVEDAQAKRMFEEGIVTVGYMRHQVAAERNKVASWMMAQGYATGHGDTTEDLLKELECQVRESEREACAKVCEGITSTYHENDPRKCADAIRARGQS